MKKINLKTVMVASAFAIAMPVLAACPNCTAANNCEKSCEQTCNSTGVAPAKVYFIKEITPENIVRLYDMLGFKADGKVGIKISTGESEKTHQLDPNLIKDFVKHVNGTLVECNTGYIGNRHNTEVHMKTAAEHGYTAIAPVDILDADGEIVIPAAGGKHIQKDIVGSHIADYDSYVVLSHFKGHSAGGFGGALKNISIGFASPNGKAYIHSAGANDKVAEIWKHTAQQDDFIESMADACKAVTDYRKGKMVYINVANNMSLDCDCDANAGAPVMKDMGIFASTDPVALDKACTDMVFKSDDPGRDQMVERINTRHGMLILPAAEKLGVGTQKYELITIE